VGEVIRFPSVGKTRKERTVGLGAHAAGEVSKGASPVRSDTAPSVVLGLVQRLAPKSVEKSSTGEPCVAWPIEVWEVRTGYKERTIRLALSDLQRAGLIEKETTNKRVGKGKIVKAWVVRPPAIEEADHRQSLPLVDGVFAGGTASPPLMDLKRILEPGVEEEIAGGQEDGESMKASEAEGMVREKSKKKLADLMACTEQSCHKLHGIYKRVYKGDHLAMSGREMAGAKLFLGTCKENKIPASEVLVVVLKDWTSFCATAKNDFGGFGTSKAPCFHDLGRFPLAAIALWRESSVAARSLPGATNGSPEDSGPSQASGALQKPKPFVWGDQ